MSLKFAIMSELASNVDAKLVTLNILVKRYKGIPADIVKHIAENLQADTIKKDIGVDIRPKVIEGKMDNNMLRVEGLSDLYDHDPNSYKAILDKLQEGMLDAKPASNTSETSQADQDAIGSLMSKPEVTKTVTPPVTEAKKPEAPKKLSDTPNDAEMKELIQGFIRKGKTIIMLAEIQQKYPKVDTKIVDAIVQKVATELNYVFDHQLKAIYNA